jgi:hypothetical protein
MTKSPDDELDDMLYGVSAPATVIELPRKPRRPFQPWTLADIENMPDLSYLIGDRDRPVLLEGGLQQTIGLLKSAKTFYTLEQAFCIAFGMPFHGLPTKQGQVVYILAEGGIKRNFERVRALFDKHREQMKFATLEEAMDSKQLILIDQTIKLANSQPAEPTSPESFIKEMKAAGVTKPALIVLDTWARALWESGGHDSDQQTVGPSIQTCEMIRKTLGGCTLIMVAHVGASKEAQGRAKGLTDPAGAIDGGTLCRETGKGTGVFTFKMIFQRHSAEGYTITAQLLKPSNTSPSVVLVSGEGITGAINLAKASPRVRAWLEALASLPGGSGSIDEWRNAGAAREVVKSSTDEPVNPATVRQSFKRARDELERLKAVSIQGDRATVTIDDMREPAAAGDFDEDDEANEEGV